MTPGWFVYLYLIPSVILWSVLQDDYLGGRGGWAISLLSGLFLGIFFLNPARIEGKFHLFWIPALVASLLLVATWSNTLNIPYSISLGIFMGLTLLNVAQVWPRGDAETIAIALFLLAVNAMLLLASIVSPRVAYTSLIYVYIFVAFVHVYFLPIGNGNGIRKILYYLYWALLALFLTMAARRWTGASVQPWYLIVQPFIGICSLQLFVYKGDIASSVKGNNNAHF